MKVVVIGAGVAGLAIGWRLQQAGADVTILERGRAAMGASWAAAGMIAVAGEANDETSVASQFARESSALWPSFATEVEAASGCAIDYRRNGALLVATDASDPGVPGRLEWLPGDEARRRAPMLSPDIAGAWWAPEEAQVDNRALGRALAIAFRRAGGMLSVNEAAVRFVVEWDAVRAVETPFSRHAADAYVVAAGAWTGGLGGLPPGILPPIRPVKGEMIAVAPPDGAALPQQVVRSGHVYAVPRRDRLLIGATTQDIGFDSSVTEAAAQWLSAGAIRLMPDLSRWRVVERWPGLRPGSPDGLPVLGPTGLEPLFVASGQYRNGILFAPSVADSMSRLVLGHAPAIPQFDPRRFPKEKV
ncbi:MAG TPA: glycine oxidase ThiO [Rhizomicrobium sp.]